MSDIPAAATAAFTAAYGAAPAGLWAAPGRVNLIGESRCRSAPSRRPARPRTAPTRSARPWPRSR
ncbi:hypothetical protein GCM10010168_02820 [Actinoplanes ianthinogenes]|nr:hypothetical protein GCM10010168_02820 [Actinoplanes ianthinogenes]